MQRCSKHKQLFDKLDFVVLVTKCNKDDKCIAIVHGAVVSEGVYLKVYCGNWKGGLNVCCDHSFSKLYNHWSKCNRVKVTEDIFALKSSHIQITIIFTV